MDNYLVLYFDTEFVAAIVAKNDGSFEPVPNGDEELLWLYFHACRENNRITFSRKYRYNYFNNEPGYFGEFFSPAGEDPAEDSPGSVTRLLSASGMLDLCRDKYREATPGHPGSVPVLLAYSSSIKEPDVKLLSCYLSSEGFTIESAGIPITELACHYFMLNKKISARDHSIVLFLEATSPTLFFVKHSFSGNFFLKDNSSVEKHPLMGYDPKKKAVIHLAVKEANRAFGLLGSIESFNRECERLGATADNWLSMTAQSDSNTFDFGEICLSADPAKKLTITLSRSQVEKTTKIITDELLDDYLSYEGKVVDDINSVAAIVLFGNYNPGLAENFRKVTKFNIVTADPSHFGEILNMYPLLDFRKLSDTEVRDGMCNEIARMKEYRKIIGLAGEYSGNGKTEEAVICYRKGLEICPGDRYCSSELERINKGKKSSRSGAVLFQDTLYRSRIRKSDNYFDKEEWDNAVKSYMSALDIKPADPYCMSRIERVWTVRRKRGHDAIDNELLLNRFESYITHSNLHLKAGKGEVEGVQRRERLAEFMEMVGRMERGRDGARERGGEGARERGGEGAKGRKVEEEKEREREREKKQEKIEQARIEQERIERERIERERIERERIEREREELVRFDAERKRKEKEELERIDEERRRKGKEELRRLVEDQNRKEKEEQESEGAKGRGSDGGRERGSEGAMGRGRERKKRGRKLVFMYAGGIIVLMVAAYFLVPYLKKDVSPHPAEFENAAGERTPGTPDQDNSTAPQSKNPGKASQGVTKPVQVGGEQGLAVGKLSFPGGNYYEGEVKNGKMHGTGLYHFVSAKKVTTNQLDGINPEPGDYVRGSWTEGDLYIGELFNSKGISKGRIRIGKL